MGDIISRFVDIAFKLASKKAIHKFIKPIQDFVYMVYERMLYNQIKEGVIPYHVAIIPDGNRRWARKQGLKVINGHVYGYERLKEVLRWLYELGVKVVTIYAMSYENCLYRSEEEKNNLFRLAKRGFEELAKSSLIHEYKIKVKVIGNLDLVPVEVKESAMKLEQMTKDYSERFLNIALCYGGRQEIIEAIKSIARDVALGKLKLQDINEDTVRKYLSTSHLSNLCEPDLVIRTSGEMRISNFLLWQIAYSELYFCDVLWPEFRKIDLLRAIRSYQRRERRYGR